MSSDKWIETEKDMKKKITSLTLGAMLFALCFPATAQQPAKVPRIGYLSVLDPARESVRAEAIRLAAMWCQVTNTRMFFNSPMTFLPYPPKRDSLLCVARHKAVTRTWDAPLSKALRPGHSVSGVEPSGV